MRRQINLIAKEVLTPGEALDFRPAAIPLALIAVLAILTVWSGWDFWRAGRLEKRVRQLTDTRQALQTEIERLGGEIQSVTGERTALPIAERQIQAVNEMLRTRVLWSEVLRQVSFLVPQGVYLTQLETTQAAAPGLLSREGDRGIRFVGFAQSHTTVSFFIAALEESSYFSDVALVYAEKGAGVDASRIGFELIGHLQRKL
jgi:Tfp pilus assembly protein PilN